jgi:hypothetical protein
MAGDLFGRWRETGRALFSINRNFTHVASQVMNLRLLNSYLVMPFTFTL